VIVLDLETTGLQYAWSAIASIGAVDFREPGRQFYAEPRVPQEWDCEYEDYDGVVYTGGEVVVAERALEVNGFTREQIHSEERKPLEEVLREFIAWCKPIRDRTIAGENPSFDRDFLRCAFGRCIPEHRIGYRTVDLHAEMYGVLQVLGIDPPMEQRRSAINSDWTFNCVGLPKEPTPHNALYGAKMEAEAFSRVWYGRPLFQEFAEYPIPNIWTIKADLMGVLRTIQEDGSVDFPTS